MNPMIKMAVIDTAVDAAELLARIAQQLNQDDQKLALEMVQRLLTMAKSI